MTNHAKEYAVQITKVLDHNFSSNRSEDIIKILMNHSAAEIIEAGSKVRLI